MQLLGLYIMQERKAVTKILKKGWYPFGNYRKPALGKIVKIKETEIDEVAHSIYQREGLPEISVNCIVGMNGAGKSTLLDILYRMINNFAYRMLGEKKVKSEGRDLKYARGVYADLFFICEGKQYKLSCRDLQTTIYINETGDTFRLQSVKDADDPKPILRQFFYTISTNYSIYAFNENEYIPDGIVEGTEGINGDWLKGLFHKNDGYFTPIVITPFRDGGNIDVERENRLASQRVMALALLSKAQNSTFIDRFQPHTIHYRLDLDYKTRTESYYGNLIKERYKTLDIRHVIRAFEFSWQKYYETLYPNYVLFDTSREKYDLGLFYLAYKTVKVCMSYADYKKLLKVDALVKASESLETFTKYVNRELPRCADKVINTIVAERENDDGNRNHITLKLSVCLEYMDNIYQHRSYWGTQSSKTLDEIVANKPIRNYNDAVAALPPAFYVTDMMFTEMQGTKVVQDSSWGGTFAIEDEEEFSINKMSSGERQMLYSLSYVLYHIKNIQSVREDENRVAYHNICLIFDEAELYFHPDYQRRFLGMLLEAISWCNIDREKIHSIQILIVTHSPFVLTDMLTQNTLYLKDGECEKVEQQTFGGNYYDLLNKSFFFKTKAVGDVASSVLTKMIQRSNNGEVVADAELSVVGDELIRNYLSRTKKARKHVSNNTPM